MHLLLLRHAHAVDHAASDHARPLSEKGHQQARAVASFLLTYPTRPDLVLSSTAVRALETAQPVAGALGVELQSCPWAVPGMDPQSAIGALRGFRNCKAVLLVGHQPDLSDLIAALLGMRSSGHLHVRKALLAHLRLLSADSATLEAFIPCKHP